MLKRWIGLSLLATVFAMVFVGSAQAAIGGKPLSQRELYRLYAGKTWLWKKGGGYFRRDGRFFAQTGYRKRSKVAGGWGAYRRGKVCFSGRWRTGRWKSFDATCFLHRRVGNTIYQKRLPVGKWYVFKTVRGRKNEEFRKLASGNYTGWYAKYRRSAEKRSYRKRTRIAKRRIYRKKRRVYRSKRR